MPIYMNRSLIVTIIFIVLIGSNVAMADVKVGFLGGFTGPLKSMTPAIYKAAKLAVKHVNDQGGVLDGEKIIMPNADTTCADTTAAAKAADSLVNTEKVLALVGALRRDHRPDERARRVRLCDARPDQETQRDKQG